MLDIVITRFGGNREDEKSDNFWDRLGCIGYSQLWGRVKSRSSRPGIIQPASCLTGLYILKEVGIWCCLRTVSCFLQRGCSAVGRAKYGPEKWSSGMLWQQNHRATWFGLNPLIHETFTVIAVFTNIRPWSEQHICKTGMASPLGCPFDTADSSVLCSMLNICMVKVTATWFSLVSQKGIMYEGDLDSENNCRNVSELQKTINLSFENIGPFIFLCSFPYVSMRPLVSAEPPPFQFMK